MNIRKPYGASSTHCDCECHKTKVVKVCCECHIKGHDDCHCGEKKYCCGEPRQPEHPDFPKPPGWEPGDIPAADPLNGAKDPDDLRRRFNHAVIDTIRQGGMPKGPRFGPRKDEYLPYLLIRADAGDRGNRPLAIPFWESPDVFVAPDMNAGSAPDTPPTLGGTAKAGAPNTLWAHVWNLGHAPVYNARVEFYWFNPTLGFNQAAANFIGATYVDLGDRGSGHAHRIVKCPETWVPTYLNNGHECLVVRVFEPLTDPLSMTPWDANNDRHIGQRNIAVVDASSPAELELHLRLGCGIPPGKAELVVQEVGTRELNWLAVLENSRDHGYRPAGDVDRVTGVTYPTLVRPDTDKPTFRGVDPKSTSAMLSSKLAFERGCEELEVLFYLHVDGIKPKGYAAYRIMQMADGKLTGGYTVIARKQ